jgi:hypothetical protein
MHTFKDREGLEWAVDVNVTSVKRVKSLAGVDLLGIAEAGGDLIRRLATDPVALVDVLYAVCKPQADERGVTDEQFGRGMAGDSIERAATALMEDLADFFPSGRGSVLRKALGKVREAEALATRQAGLALDAIDVASLMPPAASPLASPPPRSGGTSTNSPASSGSTPDP